MRAVLSILVFIIVISVSIIPYIVYTAVPAVSYVEPQQSIHASSIKATGTIQMNDIRDVYLTQPVMVDEVLVSLGDSVEKGELLARLSTTPVPLAALALSQQPALTGLDITSAELSQYAALLSQYGIDSQVLIDAMQEQNTASAATASSTQIVPEKEIRAPTAGIITGLNLKANGLAGLGQPAVTIGNNKSFVAVASVRESDISLVKLGAAAEITGNGMGGKVYKGYVSRIYPTATKVLSGTASSTVVQVEIVIDQPDARLKHGFTAKVEIETSDPREIVTVPYEAVRQDRNNTEYVYVYRDTQIKRQDITTGIELSTGVEAVEGLIPGDIVITEPDRISGDGALVRLRGEGKANA